MKNRHLTVSIGSMVALWLAVHPLPAQTSATTLSTASGPVMSSTPAPGAVTTSPSPGVTGSTTKSAPPHAMPYTVVKGDSLTKLATKFNTTRKKLEELNHLANYKLTPGQVIYVPASAKKLAAAAAAKAKHHAAPVEDYDIPASTFASCPVPPSNGNDDDSAMVAAYGKPAPIAALVSPSEMAADQARQKQAAAAAAAADADAQERLTANVAPPRLTLPANLTLAANPAPVTAPKPKLKPKTASAKTVAASVAKNRATITPPSAPSGWANESSHPQPQPSGMARFWHSLTGEHDGNANMASSVDDPANEWGYKFTQAARDLGDRGIDYDDDWRPPGERSAWTMDCSNTSRWLYKSVAGINLPRTASDQYYYLHLQGKAWDVPTTSYGLPDTAYLQEHLKPGDLLFWENTYKPERSPPITHVMVFLGTNAHGQWIMAGSQSSRGGEHNRRDGGPDVYVFRPSQPCGGWSSWFGLGRHVGRFCAFGRPLEADPSKFALND